MYICLASFDTKLDAIRRLSIDPGATEGERKAAFAALGRLSEGKYTKVLVRRGLRRDGDEWCDDSGTSVRFYSKGWIVRRPGYVVFGEFADKYGSTPERLDASLAHRWDTRLRRQF